MVQIGPTLWNKRTPLQGGVVKGQKKPNISYAQSFTKDLWNLTMYKKNITWVEKHWLFDICKHKECNTIYKQAYKE